MSTFWPIREADEQNPDSSHLSLSLTVQRHASDTPRLAAPLVQPAFPTESLTVDSQRSGATPVQGRYILRAYLIMSPKPKDAPEVISFFGFQLGCCER